MFRVSVYGLLGLMGFICVAHGLALYGWEVQNRRISLNWMAWVALANLTVVLLFLMRLWSYFPLSRESAC